MVALANPFPLSTTTTAFKRHRKQDEEMISLVSATHHKDTEVDLVPVKIHDNIKTTYNPNCFGCKIGFAAPDNPDDDPQMSTLFNLFVQNKHNKTSDEMLYQQLHELQVKLYVDDRRMMADFNEEEEVWTVDQIREHLTEHVKFYEFELYQIYDKMKRRETFLEECTFYKDELTGKQKVDEKNYRLLLETTKLQMSMLPSLRRTKGS